MNRRDLKIHQQSQQGAPIASDNLSQPSLSAAPVLNAPTAPPVVDASFSSQDDLIASAVDHGFSSNQNDLNATQKNFRIFLLKNLHNELDQKSIFCLPRSFLLRRFLNILRDHQFLTNELLLAALVYIKRYLDATQTNLTLENLHGLVITSLRVAQKVQEDYPYGGIYFALWAEAAYCKFSSNEMTQEIDAIAVADVIQKKISALITNFDDRLSKVSVNKNQFNRELSRLSFVLTVNECDEFFEKIEQIKQAEISGFATFSAQAQKFFSADNEARLSEEKGKVSARLILLDKMAAQLGKLKTIKVSSAQRLQARGVCLMSTLKQLNKMEAEFLKYTVLHENKLYSADILPHDLAKMKTALANDAHLEGLIDLTVDSLKNRITQKLKVDAAPVDIMEYKIPINWSLKALFQHLFEYCELSPVVLMSVIFLVDGYREKKPVHSLNIHQLIVTAVSLLARANLNELTAYVEEKSVGKLIELRQHLLTVMGENRISNTIFNAYSQALEKLNYKIYSFSSHHSSIHPLPVGAEDIVFAVYPPKISAALGSVVPDNKAILTAASIATAAPMSSIKPLLPAVPADNKAILTATASAPTVSAVVDDIIASLASRKIKRRVPVTNRSRLMFSANLAMPYVAQDSQLDNKSAGAALPVIAHESLPNLSAADSAQRTSKQRLFLPKLNLDQSGAQAVLNTVNTVAVTMPAAAVEKMQIEM